MRSHQSRWEYFRAMDARYRSVDQKWKQVILNEFCANTGYDRKYAIRLRNGPPPGADPAGTRPTAGALAAIRLGRVWVLQAVWEAAGYPWSVRLKALVPLWMHALGEEALPCERGGGTSTSQHQRPPDRPPSAGAPAAAEATPIRRHAARGVAEAPDCDQTDAWDVRVPGFTACSPSWPGCASASRQP